MSRPPQSVSRRRALHDGAANRVSSNSQAACSLSFSPFLFPFFILPPFLLSLILLLSLYLFLFNVFLPSLSLSLFLPPSLSLSLSLSRSLVFSLHASRCHSSSCSDRSLLAFVALFLIRSLFLFPRPIHPSRSTFPSFSVRPFLRRERARAFFSRRESLYPRRAAYSYLAVLRGSGYARRLRQRWSCGTFYQEFPSATSCVAAVGRFGSDGWTND